MKKRKERDIPELNGFQLPTNIQKQQGTRIIRKAME